MTVLTVTVSCCGEDPYKNYLKLIETTEPKSLDPALSTDITTGTKIALMYDNLVRFGQKSEILPSVAHAWEISGDGKCYIFFLRDSFLFWNGRPIHARDVKFSFERVLAPETKSPQTWLFNPIKGSDEFVKGIASEVSGLRVLDSLTLEIELETPFAPFLGFLGMPAAAILPREEVESAGNKFGSKPVGSGPWIFETWKADNYISFRKNPEYYFGPPKLDGIIIKNIPEVLTAAIEFEAGNIHIMAVPNSEFKYWTRSKAWQPYIHVLEELGLYYLAMNCERPPFDNLRVRQAMSMAIDREKIIHRVLHNSSKLARGAIPPGLSGYSSERQPIAYDPDRAREILLEEGYSDGCEFDLWVDPGAAVSQTLEAVQSYLNEAGFICHLVRNDWNMMRDAMRKGKTDAYWGNWWADYADAENFLAPLFHSKTAGKRNRYSNPEVDMLIETMQQSPEEKDRAALATRIDSILIQEAPYVFMWYPTSYTVTQPWVKGYEPHLMPNANTYVNVYFSGKDDN